MKTLLLSLLFGCLTFEAVAQDVAVYDTYAAAEKGILKDDNTTYVINFWATWCAPCVKELPYFEKLHRENNDVKVILVSLDSKKDLDNKLIPFLKRKKITATVVHLTDKDYNNWLPKVDANWSGSIPATWVVRGEQKQFIEHEFESFDSLRDYVNSIINLEK